MLDEGTSSVVCSFPRRFTSDDGEARAAAGDGERDARKADKGYCAASRGP